MTSPFHTSLVGFFLQLQQTFTQRGHWGQQATHDGGLLPTSSSFFFLLLLTTSSLSFLGCCSAHWQLFGLCIDLHTTTSRSNTAFSPNNERKLLNGGIGVREPQRLRFRGLTCKSCLMSLPQSWAGPTTQVVSKDPDRSQEGRDAQRREEHPLWN